MRHDYIPLYLITSLQTIHVDDIASYIIGFNKLTVEGPVHLLLVLAGVSFLFFFLVPVVGVLLEAVLLVPIVGSGSELVLWAVMVVLGLYDDVALLPVYLYYVLLLL